MLIAHASKQVVAKPGIDVGLAVLQAVSPPGTALTGYDIAEVCGCSFQRIYFLERQALRHLRNRLRASGRIETADYAEAKGKAA